MKRLRALGLLRDDDELPRSLLEACHEERLHGGLSLSLRATPDEVMGPLTHAMGGRAAKAKLLDVRTTKGGPMVLDFTCGELSCSWAVSGVEELIERLGEEFLDDDDVRQLVVLGEHEGMLQVWALRPEVLETLLFTSLLDGARNLRTLRERFDLD
ncbi:MAG: hypothetical protein ACOZQL_04690 [Myxococcota bacterium]